MCPTTLIRSLDLHFILTTIEHKEVICSRSSEVEVVLPTTMGHTRLHKKRRGPGYHIWYMFGKAAIR
jgi:hypothetical protein